MIITCPACETRYMLPTQKLGAMGRILRCVRCQHEWFQEAPNTTQSTTSGPDASFPGRSGGPAQLPVVHGHKHRKSGMGLAIVAGVILLASVGGLWAMRHTIRENLSMMSTMFDPLEPTTRTAGAQAMGLTIGDIERRISENDGFVTYTISGTITNTNTADKEVPNLRVALTDADGNVLDAWRVQPQKRLLAPGESTSWVCYFYNPPLAYVNEYQVIFADR